MDVDADRIIAADAATTDAADGMETDAAISRSEMDSETVSAEDTRRAGKMPCAMAADAAAVETVAAETVAAAAVLADAEGLELCRSITNRDVVPATTKNPAPRGCRTNVRWLQRFLVLKTKQFETRHAERDAWGRTAFIENGIETTTDFDAILT